MPVQVQRGWIYSTTRLLYSVKKSRAGCTGASGPVWTEAENSPTPEFVLRSDVRIASRHTDWAIAAVTRDVIIESIAGVVGCMFDL